MFGCKKATLGYIPFLSKTQCIMLLYDSLCYMYTLYTCMSYTYIAPSVHVCPKDHKQRLEWHVDQTACCDENIQYHIKVTFISITSSVVYGD